MQHADGDDRRHQRVDLPAHHRLRLADEGAGGDDRIDRILGMGGMAGLAADHQVEAIGGGQGRAAQ